MYLENECGANAKSISRIRGQSCGTELVGCQGQKREADRRMLLSGNEILLAQGGKDAKQSGGGSGVNSDEIRRRGTLGGSRRRVGGKKTTSGCFQVVANSGMIVLRIARFHLIILSRGQIWICG